MSSSWNIILFVVKIKLFMSPSTGESGWISVLYIGGFEDGKSQGRCVGGGDISGPMSKWGRVVERGWDKPVHISNSGIFQGPCGLGGWGGGQGGNEKMQCHVLGVNEYNRVHV